jgi:preprotein translocase subunit SecB
MDYARSAINIYTQRSAVPKSSATPINFDINKEQILLEVFCAIICE